MKAIYRNSRHGWVALAISLSACGIVASQPAAVQLQPTATRELLAADSTLGANASATKLSDALINAFADDVRFIGAGRLGVGTAAARTLLNTNPDNARSRMTWQPIGGLASHDGSNGYTVGYADWTNAAGQPGHAKYVAYWKRTPVGWRMLAYRRAAGSARSGTPDALHLLPSGIASGDSMTSARELHDAELAFSHLAGAVPLGEAFRQTASHDAVHTGSPTDAWFRVGPDSIGAGFVGSSPPVGTIAWAPDEVHVAQSGDLGITVGVITVAASEQQPAGRFPFFTIWKRDARTGAWRFAAE